MSYEYFAVPLTEEESLAHYGVKGMKWGVRRNLVANKGSGTLKVGFRPTYSNEERTSARAGNKAAKKSGTTALDREGVDATRIGKLRTPQRRAVNGLLGTKWSYIGDAGAIAAGLLSFAGGVSGVAPPSVVYGGFAVAGTSLLAGETHAAYATFFNNMKNNPRVKLKTPLTAKELADYQLGKTFVKEISSSKGSTKLTIMKNQTKIDAFDREGRKVGSQTLKKDPSSKKAPVKKAS